MRIYELALAVVDKNTVKKVRDLIEKEKGKITSEDIWEKRTLAYPLKKQKEAVFAFLGFETVSLSEGFQNKIKLIEDVLRFLLIRKK